MKEWRRIKSLIEFDSRSSKSPDLHSLRAEVRIKAAMPAFIDKKLTVKKFKLMLNLNLVQETSRIFGFDWLPDNDEIVRK